MWVWNPTSERYKDWKSNTTSVAHFELPTVETISVSGVSRGAGVVVNPGQIKSSW